MIAKLIERWKQEWWLKNASEMAKEYAHRKDDLILKLESEMKDTQEKYQSKLRFLEENLKLQERQIELALNKGKILEEEVTYRTKSLEERKLELIQADNDLKTQIKLIEAKAHPSTVYVEAFSQGVSKSLDMLMPIMSENLEKFKTKLKDDAIAEAIKRLKR